MSIYLHSILPKDVIDYCIRPYLNIADDMRLFDLHTSKIDEHMNKPVMFYIYTLEDAWYKCNLTIVYITRGNIITGFNVYNTRHGKRMKYIRWDGKKNSNHIYVHNGEHTVYSRYPISIPIGTIHALIEDILIPSMQIMLKKGFVFYPYNDNMKQLLYWKDVKCKNVDEGMPIEDEDGYTRWIKNVTSVLPDALRI